jgi:hypothetical protein
MSLRRCLLHVLAAAVLIGLTVDDAQAYVDPGSGSVLLQVLIAGLLAVGFTIKTFWGNLKRRVSGIFSRSHKAPDDDQDPS